MTRLIVYSADIPARVTLDTTDFATIEREIGGLGAGIERWGAAHAVSDEATQDEILTAYAKDIERLKARRGYRSADVVSLRPGNAGWPTLRQKFLAEHTHAEDEVRFFVAGSGAFYLHTGDQVHQIICESGDLLFVPEGTRHWFDGGPDADFTCIRLFIRPEGWVAEPTGDRISETVPTYQGPA